jgi:hypothetical protein
VLVTADEVRDSSKHLLVKLDSVHTDFEVIHNLVYQDLHLAAWHDGHGFSNILKLLLALLYNLQNSLCKPLTAFSAYQNIAQFHGAWDLKLVGRRFPPHAQFPTLQSGQTRVQTVLVRD